MLLALAGGVGGVLVASWLNDLLADSIRIGEAAKIALPLDVQVLIAALLMPLLTGVLFGLLPAWFASRSDVLQHAETAVARRHRGQRPRAAPVTRSSSPKSRSRSPCSASPE